MPHVCVHLKGKRAHDDDEKFLSPSVKWEDGREREEGEKIRR